MLENRMLINGEWGEIEYGVSYPKKPDPWDDPFIDSEWDDGWDDDEDDWEDEEWQMKL